jgi:hypothetical protein
VVQRKAEGEKREYRATLYWHFSAINTWVDDTLNRRLEEKRDDDRTWLRPVALPAAKALSPTGEKP